MKKNRTNWWLELIPYCIYIVASMILWYLVPTENSRIENDSRAYLNFVANFESFGSFEAPSTIVRTTWFGLGYPLFMVACHWAWQSTHTVIIAQIALGCLTLFALYKTAEILFDSSVACIALWLAATNLGIILYPHFFLTESLMIALISCSWWWLARYMQGRTGGYLVAAASALGYSIVIKPSVLYLMPFLIGTVAWYRATTTRSRIAIATSFALLFSALPLAYVYHNHAVYGAWYLKSVDKVNLYNFYLPHLAAAQEGSSFETEQKRILTQYPVHNYVDKAAWAPVHAELVTRITAAPLQALCVWITQTLKTIAGLYTNHLKVLLYPGIKGGDCSFFKLPGSWIERAWGYLTFGNAGWSMITLSIFELIARLICCMGLVVAVLRIHIHRLWKLWWFLLIPLLYFWATTGADGCARLRMLMEPFFIILASYGLAQIRYYYISRS